MSKRARKLPPPDYVAAVKMLRKSPLVSGFDAKKYDLRKPLSRGQKSAITKMFREFGQFHRIETVNDVVTGKPEYVPVLAKGYVFEDTKKASRQAQKRIKGLVGIKTKGWKKLPIAVLETGKKNVGVSLEGDIYRVEYRDLKVYQETAIFDMRTIIKSIDYDGEEDEQVDSLIEAYKAELYRTLGHYEGKKDVLFRINTTFGNVEASKYPATNTIAGIAEQIAKLVYKYYTISETDEGEEVNPLLFFNGVSVWGKLDGFREPPSFMRVATMSFNREKKKRKAKKRASRKK